MTGKDVNTTEYGRYYERKAETWLQQQGLTTRARNFRTSCGEIDLIMQHRLQLVFIEVKFRRRQDFGTSLEQVSFAQRRRITQAASLYLARHRLDVSCRFDVLAITGETELHYDWIMNAFGY